MANDSNNGNFDKAKKEVDEHFSEGACYTGGAVGMYTGFKLGLKSGKIIPIVAGPIIGAAAGCIGTSTIYTQAKKAVKGVFNDASEAIDEFKERTNDQMHRELGLEPPKKDKSKGR